MIVVSDTSPLNYLVLVEAIDVLPRLYDRVYIPEQVILELDHSGAPAPVRQWVAQLPAWAHVRSPAQIEPALLQNKKLDEGEIHAIALAQELRATLLVDEREAYKAAKVRGIVATGVLGVLDQAGERKLLDVKLALARLTRTNFRYSQRLIGRILEQDAQRRVRDEGET